MKKNALGTMAADFRRYMTLLSSHFDLDAIGLTIVVQEGTQNAGDPDSIYLAKKGTPDALAASAQRLIEKHLKDGVSLELPDNVEAIELTGNFRNRVGYIWLVGRIFPLQEHIIDFANDVTRTMENSKKSEFHLNFFRSMSNPHGDIVENVIAETISAGLYCNKVIAWEKKNDRLVSVNHKGYGLAVGDSLATTVLNELQSVTVDDLKTESRNVTYKQELLREGLRSFFLFPVLSDNNEDASGVIGVFYKRPHGTTDIDKFLCEFVIRYYENIWKLEKRNLELTGIAVESVEARAFHDSAVRTLVDLHELKANFLSVAQSFSDARVYGHNNENLQKSLKSAGTYLERSKRRLLKHQDSFVMANEYIELIYARERDDTEKFNLKSVVETEIQAHIEEAEDLGFYASVKFDLNKRMYRTNKEDVLSICNNFMRNSIQSLRQKSNRAQKNQIKLTIKDVGPELVFVCEDNGVGVPDEHLEKVFQVHFTTSGDVGGQGLGLAIIHAICLKHGNIPVVDSEWGKYAEFTAKVRSY